MTMMPPTITGTGIENLPVSVCGPALSAANSHLSASKRGRAHRAAKLKVRAHGFHTHEHVIQSSGHCTFRDRKGQLAIANPEAGRAARVVAGDDVDTGPDQFGHVEAVGNPRQNPGRRALARLHKE